MSADSNSNTGSDSNGSQTSGDSGHTAGDAGTNQNADTAGTQDSATPDTRPPSEAQQPAAVAPVGEPVSEEQVLDAAAADFDEHRAGLAAEVREYKAAITERRKAIAALEGSPAAEEQIPVIEAEIKSLEAMIDEIQPPGAGGDEAAEDSPEPAETPDPDRGEKPDVKVLWQRLERADGAVERLDGVVAKLLADGNWDDAVRLNSEAVKARIEQHYAEGAFRNALGHGSEATVATLRGDALASYLKSDNLANEADRLLADAYVTNGDGEQPPDEIRSLLRGAENALIVGDMAAADADSLEGHSGAPAAHLRTESAALRHEAGGLRVEAGDLLRQGTEDSRTQSAEYGQEATVLEQYAKLVDIAADRAELADEIAAARISPADAVIEKAGLDQKEADELYSLAQMTGDRGLARLAYHKGLYAAAAFFEANGQPVDGLVRGALRADADYLKLTRPPIGPDTP